MPYCTLQNMIDRKWSAELIQLTDINGSGVIDSSAVNIAIADADALIDGYLAGNYSLPLSPIPDILEKYAADIARYSLYGNLVTPQVEKRYEDAVSWLKLVGQGKIKLVQASGDVVTVDNLPQINSSGTDWARSSKW